MFGVIYTQTRGLCRKNRFEPDMQFSQEWRALIFAQP